MVDHEMERRKLNDHRLDRIEEKIDKLSEAMIQFARAEEKLIAIEKNNQAHFERMNRFSEKMDKIEEVALGNAYSIKVIHGVITIIGTAAVGSFFKVFFGG